MAFLSEEVTKYIIRLTVSLWTHGRITEHLSQIIYTFFTLRTMVSFLASCDLLLSSWQEINLPPFFKTTKPLKKPFFFEGNVKLTVTNDYCNLCYFLCNLSFVSCFSHFLFFFFSQSYCDWKFPASWEKPSIINPDVVPTPHGSRCTGANQRATLHWNQVCTSTVDTIPLLHLPRGFSTGRLVWHSVSGNNKSWPPTCKKPLLGKIESFWIIKWSMP